MSARLIKMLAIGKVVVRNTTQGEVLVNYPATADSKNDHMVVPPMGRLDLTKYATTKQLRRSPNLAELLRKGFLTVEDPAV
jgi:hypothetical protein